MNVLQPRCTLGTKVLDLRKQRGWTLIQLSERSGLSASALSKIERDKLSPTYANLVRLARGLEASPSELFCGSDSGQLQDSRPSVMKIDDGEFIKNNNQDILYLHTKLLARSMTPIIATHHARTLEDFGPMLMHNGEEFCYVLSGIIEVHTGDHSPIRLQAGESIYFDGNMPHAYLAVSRTPCLTLAVLR
jgi:transcriptional regulator with XRE-family HTH domain